MAWRWCGVRRVFLCMFMFQYSPGNTVNNATSFYTSKPLKSGSGLTNLKAAALKHPEVMVKIPRRLSSNSKGIAGVRGHLDYVSRNGKIQVETNDGERLNGKREVRDLVEDWKRLGIAEHTKHKAEAKLMQDIAVAAAGRSIVGETSVERSNTQSAENPSLHHEHGDDGLTR